MTDQRHQLAAVLHQMPAVRDFNRATINFLEPCDECERHRFRLLRAGAEYKQRHVLLDCRILSGNSVMASRRVIPCHGTERLRNAVRIDDQDHRAITENGITRKHLDVPQLRRHRFDHDLLGMEHAIDHDTKGIAADLGHNNKTLRRVAASDPEQFLEMHERQQLVAQSQHRRVLDALDAVLTVVARAHQLDHRELGDCEAFAARLDDQCGDDRERERNLDDEGRARARDRLKIDRAADLVDVVAHHVHADTAAGHVGDLHGGGKSGRKDELVNLRLGHLLDLGLQGEAHLHGPCLDALDVEPAAVIADFDDDVSAFLIGREADGAFLRLAGRQPLHRSVDAVIGAVAHQVRQRVLDVVEHLAIELGLGAVHFQLEVLAQFAGEVAHDPRQLLPGMTDRLHPRLHDAFLQFGRDVREPLQRHLEFGILVPAHDLKQLIARQHQLRHHRHEMFERIDADADRQPRDFFGALVFKLLSRLSGDNLR